MSPIFEAGQQSIDEANALHRARITEAREQRLEEDLERLTVGCVVFERKDDDANHVPKGGVVVELHPDPRNGADPYVAVVKIVPKPNAVNGITVWEAHWDLLPIRSIGEVRPAGRQARMSRCRDLHSVIGSRKGDWAEVDNRLLSWAVNLRQAS